MTVKRLMLFIHPTQRVKIIDKNNRVYFEGIWNEWYYFSDKYGALKVLNILEQEHVINIWVEG